MGGRKKFKKREKSRKKKLVSNVRKITGEMTERGRWGKPNMGKLRKKKLEQ